MILLTAEFVSRQKDKIYGRRGRGGIGK